MTLEALAEAVEMTSSFLSMLETGQRGYTQETLESIATALKTDVASLLTRDPTTPGTIWNDWEKAKEPERQEIANFARYVLTKRAKG